MARVAHGRVEVDQPVERAARPSELVHLNAPRVGLGGAVQRVLLASRRPASSTSPLVINRQETEIGKHLRLHRINYERVGRRIHSRRASSGTDKRRMYAIQAQHNSVRDEEADQTRAEEQAPSAAAPRSGTFAIALFAGVDRASRNGCRRRSSASQPRPTTCRSASARQEGSCQLDRDQR